MTPDAERGRRLDQHVHPLAGHQPADAHHQRPVAGSPGRPADAGPLVAGSGHEPVAVDAGRDLDDGGSGRRPRAGLRRRVAAGGHHEGRVAQHAAEQPGALAGSRAGTVTSAPCSTTP